MHGLLTLSLLVLSASAAFICNDKHRKLHVCCASLAPGREHKGKTPIDGQKCLAAIGKRDKTTKKWSYTCPLGMIGLAGILPGPAFPTTDQLVPACCHTNFPGLQANYGHDCVKVEDAASGEV